MQTDCLPALMSRGWGAGEASLQGALRATQDGPSPGRLPPGVPKCHPKMHTD